MVKSIFDDPEAEKEILQMLAEREKKEKQQSFNAKDIFEKITERVIGQDIIAEKIAEKIEEASYVKSKKKPITSILICGPTGTGKTELAKTLADAVYGDGEKFLYRIDCGNLGSSEADLASIIGMGKGYKGAHRGSLPDFLNTKKKGVLLFDELEKAVKNPSDPLAQVLLALIDEGRVQTKFDSATFSATECIIVMTSNAKQSELAELLKNYSSDTREEIEELEDAVRSLLVDEVFSPEFLGRIDLVTSVFPLEPIHRLKIAEKLLQEIALEYEIEADTTDKSVYFFLVEAAEGLQNTNARALRRWISDRLKQPIVKFKRASTATGIVVASVKYKGEELIITPAKKK